MSAEGISISKRTYSLIESYRNFKVEDPVRATYEFVREVLEATPERPDRVYRLEHSLRVAFWGKKIAEGEGWNPEPLVMACLLHDVGYCECMEISDFARHHLFGAEIAERFLSAIQYDMELSKSISHGIEIHAINAYDRDNELLQIATPFELSVRDADDLDRYDALRLCMIAGGEVAEKSVDEVLKTCKRRLELAESSKDRICGTETARQYWLEMGMEHQRLYERLQRQMESTKEMEKHVLLAH